MTRSPWSRRTALALTAAAVVATSLTGPAAQSAAPSPECPAAVPVDDVTRGMAVTGLTVSQGTEPEEFTGEVLGVLRDAVAPGLHLIMAELDSPALRRAGGVWAGMSGSPVYAADGRLLGAVAYGLSYGPSRFAGITPAVDMRELLDGTGGAGATAAVQAKGKAAWSAGADQVRIPPAVGRELVRAGTLTRAESEAGLSRLPIPFGVSGLAGKQLRKFVKRLDIDDVRVFATGAAHAAAPAEPIVPGGNFAAALSYGDLTAAGVGTATAVCGDEVIAFGHPFFFTGPTGMSAHNADAIYIQDDPAWTPFKVANVTAPTGTVDQDRLAGIHALLGPLPETTAIRSHVATTTGRSRDGVTYATADEYLSEIALFHMILNIYRVFDQAGPGSAQMQWTMQGTREDGSPWSYTRKNQHADSWDIAWDAVWELYDQTWEIQQNRFEDVTITDIDIDTLLEPDYRRYRLSTLYVQGPDGEYVKIPRGSKLVVTPRSTLAMRQRVVPVRGSVGEPAYVELSLRVPKRTVGARGALVLRGGDSVWSRRPAAASFDELLRGLARGTRNDHVLADVVLFAEGGEFEPPKGGPKEITRSTRELFESVVGGGRTFKVKVVRAAR